MNWQRVPAALMLAAGGCSSGADKEAAEAEIAQFRALYSHGNASAIYAAAHPELRKMSGRADFERFLRGVRGKLGRVKAAEQTGWRVNYATGGSTVQMAYSVTYEKGAGTEEFLYKREGDRLALLGFHVNSPDLVN